MHMVVHVMLASLVHGQRFAQKARSMCACSVLAHMAVNGGQRAC
jgi:hypothetical protein